MTNSTSDGRPGEFELIRKYFAPLSRNLPGAFGLTDDAATIAPPAGHDLVLKADAIVEGVHFRKEDPADTIAKKAVRVNLSDLAAKGAQPLAYLLALALPDWPDTNWIESFVRGLGEDQDEFGIALAGGDTDRTPGVLTISITMVGLVPQGTMIRRAGAKPGDVVFVTGTIGDAGGGLEVLSPSRAAWQPWEEELVSRYLIPRPRIAFGQKLRGVASASLDVSDGLIADLGHIAGVSNVRMEIAAARVPLSPELTQLRGTSQVAIVQATTAGDDYEIAFTAPAARMTDIASLAQSADTRVSEIGRVVAGAGVALFDVDGHEIPLGTKGYTHF